MKVLALVSAIATVVSMQSWAAESVLFEDQFNGKLADGWTWIRENPDGWRISEGTLEVHVEPGNMWGGTNNARNVLVRTLPEIDDGSLVVSCEVENAPTSQYEQVDLVWYFNESNMVKIGLELVDEKLSLVMGREENDKTNTLCIDPMVSTKVQLRLEITGDHVRGSYRVNDVDEWKLAGECDLSAAGEDKVSLQCYQGPADVEHWAKIRNFKIEQSKD